jgi:hypothetical protein
MSDDRVPDRGPVESPPRRDYSYESFERHERLGSGGEAVVTVATAGDGEQVALREPRSGSDTVDRSTVEAFQAAADTWRTIDDRERNRPRWADSEHVVGIVAAGDALPWVAMEFMDGGSLAERLADAPDGLPLAEAVWIAECIARGVEVAHNTGVAHLDLKPENVLFRQTPAGTWDLPKVADWGIARALLDEAGTVERFSPQYAAPEQFDRETYGDPDTLTDVYAIGAILYAMLTGAPPYTGTRANVMHGVLSGELLAPPSERRATVSSELDRIVMRALSAAKPDRYRSIGSLVESLVAVREELPSGTERSSARGPAGGPTDMLREQFVGEPTGWDDEGIAGRDLQTSVEVTLAEAAAGASRGLEITRPGVCPACEGAGHPPGAEGRPCSDCDSEGEVYQTQETPLGRVKQSRDCQRCGGAGTLGSAACRICDGNGILPESATFRVDVLAGIRDGQTLRFPNEGAPDPAPDGVAGDLLVEVSVADDGRFERDGADLGYDLDRPVTPGEEVEIPSPDGPITTTVPPDTSPGDVLRLAGRGMPELGGEGRGDLFLRFPEDG